MANYLITKKGHHINKVNKSVNKVNKSVNKTDGLKLNFKHLFHIGYTKIKIK